MKKKFFVAALAATIFATTAMGLAACSKDAAATSSTPNKPSSGGGTEYTITLDANGGSFAGGASTKTVTTDKSGVIESCPAAPTTAPTVDHTFKGWGLSASSKSAISFPKEFDRSRPIYAIWEDNGEIPTTEFSITFDAQEGTFTEDTAPVTRKTINGKINAGQTPDVTRDGYALVGWYTQPKGAGTLVTSHTFTLDTTVYAYWKESSIIGGDDDELIVGDYYLVGEGAGLGWTACSVEGHIGENSGEIKLPFAKNGPFKIVKCISDEGGIDWGSSYGISAVSVGKGYVKGDNDGNIVIKVAATYTVKLTAAGKVEISSTEVEEPELTIEIDGYNYEEVKDGNYYLVGAFIGESYSWGNGYAMIKDGDQYIVEGFTVEAGAGIRIRNGEDQDGCAGYAEVDAQYGNKNWVETDDHNNIVFKEGGTYSIYYKPGEGKIYLS